MADAKRYEQIALSLGQKEAMQNINEAMKDNIKAAAQFLLV